MLAGSKSPKDNLMISGEISPGFNESRSIFAHPKNQNNTIFQNMMKHKKKQNDEKYKNNEMSGTPSEHRHQGIQPMLKAMMSNLGPTFPGRVNSEISAQSKISVGQSNIDKKF